MKIADKSVGIKKRKFLTVIECGDIYYVLIMTGEKYLEKDRSSFSFMNL